MYKKNPKQNKKKDQKSINCSVIGGLFIAATDFIIRVFTFTLSNQIDEALHIQTGHFSPLSYITHMSFPPSVLIIRAN